MHTPSPRDVVSALGLPALVSADRMPGFDAAVWRCSLADGDTVAVRLLRPGRSGAADVANLRLAADHGQPAPRVLATARVADREAVAATWCAGRPIAELLLGGDRRPLGLPFGRAHARMHHPVEGGALCHLDYHPFNVLVDADNDEVVEVSGIVDWTNARIDDARCDIAMTRVLLALAPDVMAEFAPLVDDLLAQWRTGYQQIRPMPGDDELEPFLADAAQRQARDWARRAGDSPSARRIAEHAQRLVGTWSR